MPVNTSNISDQFDEGAADKAAEEINNVAQDRVEEAKANAVNAAESTPTDSKGFAENAKTAPKTRKRIEEKQKGAKITDEDAPEKFEVDLDRYTEFVDRVTSEASRDFDTLIARYNELKAAGCNISRLDTAASGLVAEAGEFMEIVKKIKFQGKPYDAANKEHLTKELGDIMWYIAQAALALDVRLDEVIYINTLKLAARYPGGMFETNYSENRQPGDI